MITFKLRTNDETRHKKCQCEELLGDLQDFYPAISCRKTAALKKIIFRRREDCFRDVLVEFLSCHSARDCTGVWSFINQAHIYPKQSTTYGRENSIVLPHFIHVIINQHIALHWNAKFNCQAPKMNLTGISLRNVAISILN